MTNFDFLKDEKQFAAFADACIESEKSISASPALCALGVRKSAELAVKWLYSVDRSLRMPYKDNFSALVYNQSFIDTIDEDILDRLKYIIKLGNFPLIQVRRSRIRKPYFPSLTCLISSCS